VKGVVVECGYWKGGAAVNLSLMCEITGRTLKVYDSFEGLPPAAPGDPIAQHTFRNGFLPGLYVAPLAEFPARFAVLVPLMSANSTRGD
jgi:hypothetical protein